MKNIKKLVGLALALALALSLAIPAAFAANGDPAIVINDPVAGETYNAYKIFDLPSVSEDGQNYTYAIYTGSVWYDFVREGGAGAAYIDLEASADPNMFYVSAHDGFDDTTAQAFAQAALAYAEAKPIAPDSTVTATSGAPLTMPNINSFGYYLVDSSLGALCSLNTTTPTANITEKNDKPFVEKEVLETDNNTYSDKNEANIGDTVTYRTTITAQPGGRDYVLRDKMDAGLTFNTDSVTVTVGNTFYEMGETTWVLKTENLEDGYTFEIEFANTFIDIVAPEGTEGGTKIVVAYTATLNDNAIVYGDNHNDTYLKYNNDDETTHSTTNTKTYGFNLVKVDKDDNILSGATFSLYDQKTDGNLIPLFSLGNNVYRLFKDGVDSEDAKVTEFTAGNVVIKGLDAGEYWLNENMAPPEGNYNKLTERQSVTLSEGSGDLWHASVSDDGQDYLGIGGVPVVNLSGALLPSTGGMGTTIFYIGGGILAVGAVILLIVRRRMRVDAE